MITAGIIVTSDKGSAGLRKDKSGPIIKDSLKGYLEDIDIRICRVIPDEKQIIINELIKFIDEEGLDLVITSGGTGVSPRDVTPEATLEILERIIPGIAEAMRIEGLKKTPYAMISRAVAGIRKRSLVINLPGSPIAAKENLMVVLPAIRHLIEKIKGDQKDCLRKEYNL